MRRLLVLGMAVCLVLTAIPSATVAVENPQPTFESTADERSVPTKVYTVSLLNRSGNVTTFRIHVAFRGLDDSTSHVVTAAGREQVQVRSTTGLSTVSTDTGGQRWTFSGNATDAGMTVLLRTNRTESTAGEPRILLSLLDVVSVRTENGSGITNRRVEIRGTGLTAGRWAYFGSADVTMIYADGQRIPIVTPSGVEPDLSPERIAEAINRTSRYYGFSAPPDTLSIWYDTDLDVEVEGHPVEGLGGYDTIQLVAGADTSTVRHEYVHILQEYRSADNLTWFTEGSANYLANLAALQHGQLEFETFYRRANITNGSDDRGPTSPRYPVLSGEKPYTVGQHLVAALDLRIRRETDGNASVVDVIIHLNRHAGEKATTEDVYRAVRETGGRSVATWLRTVIQERTLPPIPEPSTVKPVLARAHPDADFDDDGLSNADELDHATDPFNPDTDDDSLSDGYEVEQSLDPNAEDTDGDGASDSIDSRPLTPTLGGRLKSIGLWVLTFSVVLAIVTIAGSVIFRLSGRLIGGVSRLLPSVPLSRLLGANVGLFSVGGVVYALGSRSTGAVVLAVAGFSTIPTLGIGTVRSARYVSGVAEDRVPWLSVGRLLVAYAGGIVLGIALYAVGQSLH